jgi:hypothetical protein
MLPSAVADKGIDMILSIMIDLPGYVVAEVAGEVLALV